MSSAIDHFSMQHTVVDDPHYCLLPSLPLPVNLFVR